MDHLDQKEVTPSTDVQYATSPFDLPTARGADLILRSTDNVDFCVSSAIITFSCPIFHQEIANNTTSNKLKPTLPKLLLIDLQVSSAALYYILYFIYPVGATVLPDMSDFGVLAEVMAFSEKYGIQKCIDSIRTHAETVLQDDPYRALILARQCGWKDLERQAICETFRKPFDDIPLFPELALLSGIDFRNILKIRVACGRELASWGTSTGIGLKLVPETTDTPTAIQHLSYRTSNLKLGYLTSANYHFVKQGIQVRCLDTRYKPVVYTRTGVPSWFLDYQSNVLELLQTFPHPQTIDSAKAKELTQKSMTTILQTCETCTSAMVSIQDDIATWQTHVKAEVERIISTVEMGEDD